MRRALAHIGSRSRTRGRSMSTQLLAVLGVGAVLVFVAAFILQSEPSRASSCIPPAPSARHLRLSDRTQPARRARRPDRRACADRADDLLLHLLPADVHLAESVRAAQRRLELRRCSAVHLFTWIPGQYQDLNSIWIVLLSPVLVWIYNALGKRGKDPSIAAKFALGFRDGRGRLLHLRRGRQLRRRTGKVSSWVHDLGLWPVFAGRAAGERPGPGHDRALRAGAHGRLHDGRVLRRRRASRSTWAASWPTTRAVPQNVTDPMQSLPIYTACSTSSVSPASSAPRSRSRWCGR